MINKSDVNYLRDLAKKQLELSNLDIMRERERRWYDHNALKGEKPMIVVELASFYESLIPELKASTPFGRQVELELMMNIVSQEMIDDDKVVPNTFRLPFEISVNEFGFNTSHDYVTDDEGRKLSYEWKPPMKNITEDYDKIKPPVFTYNKELTLAKKAAAEELLGDIMPVEMENTLMRWHITPTYKAIDMLGLEQWLFSMSDEPEMVHKLLQHIVDVQIEFYNWQSENGLLVMNNGNHYAGAGSYGFSDELKAPADGKITTKSLWANMNSQESSTISPRMFRKFIYPYYEQLAKQFGLVYYGCCEATDVFWKDALENLPNLRKLSVSMWANEDRMGEYLTGTNVIYSRKPAPQFLGVGYEFDEDGYRKHIQKTLDAAKNCHLEFIFRDVYTLSGNNGKAKQAVQILREMIDSN